MNIILLSSIAGRARSVGFLVADGCAAAGLHTSCASWAAAHPQRKPRTQGELPRVPTLPQRSLLLRKLVEYQRAAQPPVTVEKEAVLTDKQQLRAARRKAAEAYLTSIRQAASQQDIQTLLRHLESASPSSTAAAAAARSSSSSSSSLPPSGSLLSAAATLAVKQLAAASGRPEAAQAFLELALERELLLPQQIQRGLHAVLQAYVDRGDNRGALAAAARFFDTGSGSSLLPSGSKPSSCTLALLLAAAANTSEPDLLIGAWRYFGDQWQQQQQQISSSSSSTRRTTSAADALAPANVLHALVYGSAKCDLAVAAAAAAAADHSTGSHGFAAGAIASVSASSVSTSLFHAESTTIEVLREINKKLELYQQQQQWQQQQQRKQQQRQGSPMRLPLALLHPCQASELLQCTQNASDVDLLLLSQLYQPQGLSPNDIIKIAKRIGIPMHHQQQQQQQQQHPLTVLPDLQLRNVPLFPPKLRSDVARAAVQAYLRHGALQRAAAVAHAAAVANPRDIQQYHVLVRGFAAAGQLLPALVITESVRQNLWQNVSPKAQADMLRTLARCGSSPPLGAAPSSSRLSTFFRRRCTPHPKTWGALIQGLVITGDPGPRVWKTLRSAMIQPYNFMAMAGFSPMFVDKARSQIVAQMIRGILAARSDQSRLAAVAAAADDFVAAAGNVHSHSSSSSTSKRADLVESRLSVASLLHPTTAAAVYAPHTVLSEQQQQQQQQQHQQQYGVPLHEQSVHRRTQVLLLLKVFDVLQAWGVTLHHDAALAAALQVLRFCSDTEDARESGLLVAVLRSSLSLGIQPGRASLRALLSCCADLESRPGKTPLGLTTGSGFRIQGLGEVELAQVLAACEQAIQQQQGEVEGVVGSSGDVAVAAGSSRSTEVHQAAADLLRQWAFNATFTWVEGVLNRGPTWALSSEAQLESGHVLKVGRSSSGSSSSNATAVAVGM